MSTLLELSNKVFENGVSADARVNAVLVEVIKDFPGVGYLAKAYAKAHVGLGPKTALRIIAAIGLKMVELER